MGDFNIVDSDSPGFNVLEDAGFQIVANNEGSNKDQTKFYDQISFMPRANEIRRRRKGVLQFFDSIFRGSDFRSYRPEVKKSVRGRLEAAEKVISELSGKMRKSSSASEREKHKKKVAAKRESLGKWKRVLGDEAKLREYYEKVWRTFHASDHLPLWVELEIDFGDEYLERLGSGGKQKA